MELTYTKCGDYLIPDLVLSDTKEYHIGKYGRLRRAYPRLSSSNRLYIYILIISGSPSPCTMHRNFQP